MYLLKVLTRAVSGVALAGVGVAIPNMVTPAGAEAVASTTKQLNGPPGQASDWCPGDCGASADKWGIIGRNTLGSPNAVARFGPYGRNPLANFSANMPPPYGVGSLGIIVGSGAEKIAFGNETDFARIPIRSLRTLKYWVFAGMDSLAGVSLPLISIEADPNLNPAVNYTSLNYLPDDSLSPSAPSVRIPNIWQQYNATAAGNQWYATGATGTTIGCTLADPCSFDELNSRLPDAVISFSLGISKGRDTPFVGAVDGLQVNRTVYDFEPTGVRTRYVR